MQVGLGLNMMSGDDFQKQQANGHDTQDTSSKPPAKPREPDPEPAPMEVSHSMLF